ncbi:MAG: hypothetical protein IH596_00745 [Bacteroidales bacterium]|nr:hypothetical protein [Bacteroidales bacterium]
MKTGCFTKVHIQVRYFSTTVFLCLLSLSQSSSHPVIQSSSIQHPVIQSSSHPVIQ